MLSVTNMIIRIRSSTHDQQKTGYSDDDLLAYINDGVRFVRRTVMSIAPTMLADIDLSGELAAGESKVTSEKAITSMVEARVNGIRVPRINAMDIADTSYAGIPNGYYVTGMYSVNFFPIPDVAVKYRILAVSDMENLTIDSASPFLNDMDDFVYEYALIRASIGNEFDVSQETSLMSTIVGQITTMLNDRRQEVVQTAGYWNPPCRTTAYGGRLYR